MVLRGWEGAGEAGQKEEEEEEQELGPSARPASLTLSAVGESRTLPPVLQFPSEGNFSSMMILFPGYLFP